MPQETSRATRPQSADAFARFGPFLVEIDARRVIRDDAPLELSPRGFDLLAALLESDGAILSKQELLDSVWAGASVGEAVVKVSVAEIRRVLGDDARSPRYVETVSGVGYRFIAPVVRADRPRPSGLHAPGRLVPLVGRDHALETLHSDLALASSGRRCTRFVTGEPGMGKTTLVDAFVRRATSQGVMIAEGGCREHYGEGESFLPLIEALTALVRSAGGGRVLDILRRTSPMWVGLVPEWSQGAGRDEDESTSRRSRGRMLREFVDGIEAIATEGPILLVFEDLHWSDASTIDALSALAQRNERGAILLLGTYRPDEVRNGRHPLGPLVDRLVASGVGSGLELTDLEPQHVRSFVTQLRGDAIPENVIDLIARRSEGNPLFMAAYLEQLEADGYLDVVEPGPSATPSLDTIDSLIPDRLRGLFDRKLERLPPDHLGALEAASVIGAGFDAAAVSEVLGDETGATERILEEVARNDAVLIVLEPIQITPGVSSDRYRFRHVLLQNAVCERIGPARRRNLHARVARVLAARGAPAAELAFHLDAAGSIDEAIEAWERAGAVASQHWATTECVSHLERALAALPQLPHTIERDRRELRLLVAAGGPVSDVFGPGSPRVASIYARAQALSESLEDAPEIVPMLAGLFIYRIGRAEHREAERIAAQVSRIVEPLDVDLMRQSALLLTGIAHLYRGRFEKAVVAMDQALELAPGESAYNWGQDASVLSLMFSSFALHAIGRTREANERSALGVDVARRGHDAHLLTTSMQFRSILLRWRGDVDGARGLAEEVDAISLEHGLELWAPVTGWVTAWARAIDGDLLGGLRAAEAHLDRYAESGTKASRTDYMAATAALCLEAGEIERGMDWIARALEASEKSGERIAAVELHRVHAELLAATGGGWRDLDRLGVRESEALRTGMQRAEEAARRAIDVSIEQGARTGQLRATTTYLQLARGGPSEADARDRLTQSIALWGEREETVDLRAAEDALRGS